MRGRDIFFCLFAGGWMLFSVGCRKAHLRPGIANPVIGVKIYDTQRKASDLVREWKNLGINTVFAGETLNQNEDFRRTVRKNKITRFVILPIFYDPDALKADSTLFALTAQGSKAVDDWVTFVCPSRESFRKRKIESILKMIRGTDPDGLSIDFIRHFVFWEMVYPDRTLESLPNTCFDDSCMVRFQKDTGIRIPQGLKSPQAVADWIRHHRLEPWTNWKCGLIASFVKEVSGEARKIKPGILINIHAVPWRRDDFGGAVRIVAGQDFPELSQFCQMLSPMAYHHMVKQNPGWVHAVVEEFAEQVSCPVVPSIQVGKTYVDNPLSVEEFTESLKEALKTPSKGVVLWSWEALEKEPEKKEAVQNMMKQHANQQPMQ